MSCPWGFERTPVVTLLVLRQRNILAIKLVLIQHSEPATAGYTGRKLSMESVLRILVWFLLFAGVSTPVVPVESASSPPPMQAAPMGEPFTLNYGETATLDGGSLTLAFLRVAEDSRCPQDVLCAWSGQVGVALQVTVGDEVQTVELGGFTDYEGLLRPQQPDLGTTPSVAVGDYTVELLAVMPYPAVADQRPEAEEYQVQLRVLSEP